MKIYEITDGVNEIECKNLALCLGFFDGVHLGHQKIIKQALNEGYNVGVLTFDNPPSYILGMKSENTAITSMSDKADYFKELGVKYFFFMHFDANTLKVTKDEFIDNILKPLKPAKIFCGEDYTFGARREGDVKYLMNFFELEVVPFEYFNNHKVSSREIRDYISNGDMKSATELLGRPYRIGGLVVQGKKNGRLINFPTANLDLDYEYVYPKDGVYMGYAHFLSKKKKAVISVGTHPTIMPLSKPIIEVHIIDFHEEIYGQQLFIDFIDFIRDIETFTSLDELKEQIQKDAEFAKNSL